MEIKLKQKKRNVLDELNLIIFSSNYTYADIKDIIIMVNDHMSLGIKETISVMKNVNYYPKDQEDGMLVGVIIMNDNKAFHRKEVWGTDNWYLISEKDSVNFNKVIYNEYLLLVDQYHAIKNKELKPQV